MDCVNCGRENPNKALICYWCALDPATGENPYSGLSFSTIGVESESVLIDVPMPGAIEVPSPLAVPGVDSVFVESYTSDLTIPEPPPIVVPSAPSVPDFTEFTASRRRARHRPIVRVETSGPMSTRPVLSGCTRTLVTVLGAAMLVALALTLVAALALANFGGAFCVLGLFGLAGLFWIILVAARTGKRIVAATGGTYERLEVLGRVLREVAPGVVQELPVNLPSKTGVLDQPVAYSELRALASDDKESLTDYTADLLIGSIASLVGRDDVLLARRTYPVETRGRLTRPTTITVSEPVLTRRRIYTGPGELERRVARNLRTDYPMTVDDLFDALLEPGTRKLSEQIAGAVGQALEEDPPNLDALSSPESTLAEFQRFRKALRRADPDLYALLEDEVRTRLANVAQRSVPSSLLDAARYVTAVSDSMLPPKNQSDAE